MTEVMVSHPQLAERNISMKPTNEDGSPARPMRLIKRPDMISRMPTELQAFLPMCYESPEGLHIIAAHEPTGWHISVTGPMRYPTWDELRDIAWAIRPKQAFSILIPPRSEGTEYLNLQGHCIHLWEA